MQFYDKNCNQPLLHVTDPPEFYLSLFLTSHFSSNLKYIFSPVTTITSFKYCYGNMVWEPPQYRLTLLGFCLDHHIFQRKPLKYIIHTYCGQFLAFLWWSNFDIFDSYGNLMGPESDFEIKASRKVGCDLTSNKVHLVSLANNYTIQF